MPLVLVSLICKPFVTNSQPTYSQQEKRESQRRQSLTHPSVSYMSLSISPCSSLPHYIQQRFLSRGRRGLDTVHSQGWQQLALLSAEFWALQHACRASALLLFTHLCHGHSMPGQGQQISEWNQNLLPLSCQTCCWICKFEEGSPVLWQVMHVRCTQVISPWVGVESAWVEGERREHPCPVFVTHANHCLSCSLLFSPGTSGISLSHNFYSGSIFKSNSIWTSLSPQRLPPQWLEFTRFYNRGRRVSTSILPLNALHTWGHREPVGAQGWMRFETLLMGDVRGCCPLRPPLLVPAMLTPLQASCLLPSVTVQSKNTGNSHWFSAGITWFIRIDIQLMYIFSLASLTTFPSLLVICETWKLNCSLVTGIKTGVVQNYLSK